VINDHRPYQLKRFNTWLETAYTHHFIAPQLSSLGSGSHFMKPWNISLFGGEIHVGDNVHIVTARDRRVCLSSWSWEQHQGHILIGNQCLICPGVRIDSATSVTLEDNSMLAAGVYVTDADWHDIYDRTRPVGRTLPVTIGNNAWIGDGSTICKGVTVGENSIVGAGAVVVDDVPANSLAAGNPARVIRQLDPTRTLVTRADLFRNPAELAASTDRLNRFLLNDNTWSVWLRSILFPRRGD